jgi:REP element-mobilizing transposase RayT
MESMGSETLIFWKSQANMHAFVLMTNHVHLLMTPETEKGVSQHMQSLGRYYVMYIIEPINVQALCGKGDINLP